MKFWVLDLCILQTLSSRGRCFNRHIHVFYNTVGLSANVVHALHVAGIGTFFTGWGCEFVIELQFEEETCQYWGETLAHISFGLFGFADSRNPVTLLGPLVNYLFLRFMATPSLNEETQELRFELEKSPNLAQLNEWLESKNSL
ncbi:DUF1295-domain-containing protein [Penicillium alfredii]|uniref:DUF1295-domain-containing protein n=1 Tax=Penicillium alfredii TaxID=1506179 RepID=A0A9W9G917_9EURO|nr:DUF1295-domain-containing protein [Penicillium alfredii]KAJ5114400.1 DUF1295-domain-containing protein [Penicillium alfredii]